MKTKITFFTILLVAVIGSSCASRRSATIAASSLIGTWELVPVEGSGTLSRKIINDTHFITTTYTRNGQVVRTTHGGTYTLNGNVYVENVEFSSRQGMANTTSIFVLEMRGDRKYISGTFADGRGALREVWRRVH